ncbi:MAG: hypothetical protein ACXW5U_14265 [Thermoanaerobaculia bacterium]
MTRWARRLPLIAPILLSAVALIQLYAARTTWLTPWKGGGFGMFSTVDSPGARFLRIALETDRGTVRVGAPAQLQRDAARLREAPDLPALRAFAKKVAAGTWVPDRAISAEKSYILLLAGASSRDGRIPPYWVDARGQETTYRMLGEDESPREPPLHVNVVCAEIWRYRVEPRVTRLTADRLARACAASGR